MKELEHAVVTLRLPSTLRESSGGRSQLVLHVETIAQLLEALRQDFPQVWEVLCDEHGHLRSRIHMFVNNQRVSLPDDLTLELKSGQEVIVLPAIGES